jgi:phage terminase small subunit
VDFNSYNNLTEREQWKWNLSRLLYERDYNRKQIADLYKVIDFMMTLSEELQYSFEEKLSQYQEERKMRLLSNIEQRASIRISQENIMELLEDRFGNLPESLVEKINQIKDLNRLKYLLRQTIHVNSVAEFEHLINDSLDNQNESTINE